MNSNKFNLPLIKKTNLISFYRINLKNLSYLKSKLFINFILIIIIKIKIPIIIFLIIIKININSNRISNSLYT